MDPTPQEIAAFDDIGKVADWAHLVDPARAAFFGHLGVLGTASLRIVGGIPKADYLALTQSFRLPGQGQDPPVPPTAAQLSQVGLFWAGDQDSVRPPEDYS